jgi:DNA-directed RNA polymerase sigma subunit (sigma70/sigma32)
MEQQVDMVKIMNELRNLKEDIAEMKVVLSEDLEFSKRIDESWERHDKGEFIEMDSDDFSKELEKW